MPKKITVESETSRLNKIYKELPANQFAVVQGMIIQAARLRVTLDNLWADIQENGTTEWFQQGENNDPYLRERPTAKQFIAADKSYQAIIRQLNELTPVKRETSKLSGLMNDD